MKKLLFLLIGVTLLLAACGDDEPTSEGSNGTNDTYFDNGDYEYEIKEIEQVSSDMGEILAIELTFTNNTDDAQSPWMSLGIQAEQETESTVETLNGALGMFPDDYKTDLVEMGDTDVKPGESVDAVIGYELEYPGEQVRLYDMWEEGLFEKTVDTE